MVIIRDFGKAPFVNSIKRYTIQIKAKISFTSAQPSSVADLVHRSNAKVEALAEATAYYSAAEPKGLKANGNNDNHVLASIG